MAHLAASWPDQVLCKENKRAALVAQHKSWMCQRDRALRKQAAATASTATAPATAPEHESPSSHEDDELHEELQEITAFLDGVGCAIEDDRLRAAASDGDGDGEEASSFIDSDEEVDDAAFARYAAARRQQLSSAATGSGDRRALGDDVAETSWATLGAACSTGEVASRLRFWHRPANQEDLTLGASSRWSGEGTIITGVRLWPAAVGLASVLEPDPNPQPSP